MGATSGQRGGIPSARMAYDGKVGTPMGATSGQRGGIPSAFVTARFLALVLGKGLRVPGFGCNSNHINSKQVEHSRIASCGSVFDAPTATQRRHRAVQNHVNTVSNPGFTRARNGSLRALVTDRYERSERIVTSARKGSLRALVKTLLNATKLSA